KIAIPVAIGALLVLGGAGVFARGASNRQWARKALPEIERLSAAQRFAAAFDLARKAETYIPKDADLRSAWETIARPFSITTDPPGAAISFADYADASVWIPIESSPAESIRFPRGPIRVRVEK